MIGHIGTPAPFSNAPRLSPAAAPIRSGRRSTSSADITETKNTIAMRSGKLTKEKTRAYPKDWKEISEWVRFKRAKGRCECRGECGLHKDHPGPRRCEERNGKKAKWARGKVVLTTAHLCHGVSCRNKRHLRAMCNRCHLRYDVKLHVHHARLTRERKSGQMRLL